VKHSLMLGTAATALALLAGCGSSKTTTSNSTGAAATAPTTSAAAATGGSRYGSGGASSSSASTATNVAAGGMVVTTKHGKLGTVLAAGPKKLTVYLFEADKATASACSSACASAWPPVTTGAAPSATGSALAADLGTITRSDGTKQVTYKGHPLYFFIKDKDNGDAYGQGVKSFGSAWYTLAPSGAKVDKS
jgi:predicted lipoprotein with Yx(FWY)xxD motif